MYFVALHVDSTERACGTQVLAGTATDTPLGVDGRHSVGTTINMHHCDSPRRAMAGAVAALHIIGKRHTILAYPYGVPHLRGGLVFTGDGTDSPCGAYLAATGTFRAAVTSLVGHSGLHEGKEVLRGAQHIVGASGDA